MNTTTLTYHCPEHLLNKRLNVALVGVGGTGSEVLDGLARMHHGLLALGHPGGMHVTVFDGDTVSESNVGRQRFALCDVGLPKATTLVHRYNVFYGLDWDAVPHFAEAAQLRSESYDLIVTCVDKAAFRAELGWHRPHAAYRSTLWLDMGNGRTEGQVILGHWGARRDGLYIPNVCDLYPELATMPEDDDTPSCSLAEAIRSQNLWVNKFASMGLALLWDLLTTGRLDRHGFYFDSSKMTMTPMMIDTMAWAMMGYTNDEARKAA